MVRQWCIKYQGIVPITHISTIQANHLLRYHSKNYTSMPNLRILKSHSSNVQPLHIWFHLDHVLYGQFFEMVCRRY